MGLNPDVKFLLPAVLDSWAGQPISAPLEHSQLVLDLAGGHRHELTENMRSDPGIFDFVKWLQVGESSAPALEEAKARARELFSLRSSGQLFFFVRIKKPDLPLQRPAARRRRSSGPACGPR